MSKIKTLHLNNDRIKEQLHALENSTLFSKKDKLQLGCFYRKKIQQNTLKIKKLTKAIRVTTSD